MMMTSRSQPRVYLLAVFLTMTACRSGCRGGSEGATKVDPALALFPPEAQVFASVDFSRIRQTRLWQELQAFAGEDPRDRQLIDQLKAQTGFDPFRQVHRVVAAFPEEARQSRAFGIVIEGDKLDRQRLFAYLRGEAQKRGAELVQRPHGQHTLWTSNTPDAPSGFFLDDRRFVLGAGGWTERMADRAAGKTVDAGAAAPALPPTDAAALARLIDRVGKGRSIWMVARVPEATRARLMADPRFGSDASVLRFGASVDFGPDLAGDLIAELNNAADAQALVGKATTFVAAAKKSPEVLLLGVAPYLEGIKAEAEGPNARIRFALPKAQTDELIGRLVGLLRLRRPSP
ncbi:MAG TPA: hypothetical protein VGG33_07740 [Polyangia bacterium]